MPLSRPAPAWRYSRWDGSHPPPELDGEDVLAAISDDLLYHGDADAALRQLLQEGLTNRAGERIAGLRELMERLRARREELRAGADPSGLAERVAAELDEILAAERAALDQAGAAAAEQDRPEEARRVAERHTELDLLPDPVAEQIRALEQYEFESAEAAERFAALVEGLRQELAQLQLDRTAGALAGASEEERAHLRDGIDALNRMLEQRAAGEPIDPSFESFMESFGDLFPGAESLDDLLERLGARLAAAAQMLSAMRPDQRAQLESLAESLLGDLDLAWQLDRLGENLRNALPAMEWGGRPGSGGDPVDLPGALDALDELASLNRLERMLRRAGEAGALAELDPEEVERLLGPESAAALRELARLTARLTEAGLMSRREGKLQMTPRGLRRLGQRALAECFEQLRRDRFGEHELVVPGIGLDRENESKPYEFGDPFRLDVEATIRNALVRRAGAGESGLPVHLELDDFEIERNELLSNSSTVLAIDLSLSMPMRDNFLAAKKVAMALHALISSRYPRDFLGLVGFSATARAIRPEELPELSWDFAYGTNLQHALALGRRMLGNRAGSKQIIVITDGEPTAHVLEDGEVFFNYPPVRETVVATLEEVVRCTRERIVINTFVLDATGGLRSFVEEMTKRNKGRAFFTTPGSLGDYLLVDFVKHRGGQATRLRAGA